MFTVRWTVLPGIQSLSGQIIIRDPFSKRKTTPPMWTPSATEWPPTARPPPPIVGRSLPLLVHRMIQVRADKSSGEKETGSETLPTCESGPSSVCGEEDHRRRRRTEIDSISDESGKDDLEEDGREDTLQGTTRTSCAENCLRSCSTRTANWSSWRRTTTRRSRNRSPRSNHEHTTVGPSPRRLLVPSQIQMS